MSLFESGDSSGSMSLQQLFSEQTEAVRAEDVNLEHLISLTVRGGWPGSLGLNMLSAAQLPVEYLRNIVEDDIHRIDDVKRITRKMQLLLRSLARNESTVVSNRTLRQDMLEDDGETIDVDTVADYLTVMQRLFLIED